MMVTSVELLRSGTSAVRFFFRDFPVERFVTDYFARITSCFSSEIVPLATFLGGAFSQDGTSHIREPRKSKDIHVNCHGPDCVMSERDIVRGRRALGSPRSNEDPRRLNARDTSTSLARAA